MRIEVLADVIRKNCDIKGITVNGSKVIISQYAEDTTLILDGSRRSLTTSLKVLDLFSEISGLRLNRKKTEALWIGANTDSEEKLCPEIELKWLRDKVKTLGVWLSTDPVLMMKANYDEKLIKFYKLYCKTWLMERDAPYAVGVYSNNNSRTFRNSV